MATEEEVIRAAGDNAWYIVQLEAQIEALNERIEDQRVVINSYRDAAEAYEKELKELKEEGLAVKDFNSEDYELKVVRSMGKYIDGSDSGYRWQAFVIGAHVESSTTYVSREAAENAGTYWLRYIHNLRWR